MIFKKKTSPEDAPQTDAPEQNEELTEEVQNTADETVVEGLEDIVSEEETAADPVAELQKALEEEKERSLRLYAELDNVRRRASRELLEERKYSGMEVIRALLPVMDNLQRAIEAASAASAEGTNDALLEGVRMIYQQMTDSLAKNHCTRIEAQDQQFDPNFHEAISQMPNADVPENTVLFVAQDGYLLHDRVVRPTQVVVSKKP